MINIRLMLIYIVYIRKLLENYINRFIKGAMIMIKEKRYINFKF
jgi:hypothetical protein